MSANDSNELAVNEQNLNSVVQANDSSRSLSRQQTKQNFVELGNHTFSQQ